MVVVDAMIPRRLARNLASVRTQYSVILTHTTPGPASCRRQTARHPLELSITSVGSGYTPHRHATNSKVVIIGNEGTSRLKQALILHARLFRLAARQTDKGRRPDASPKRLWGLGTPPIAMNRRQQRAIISKTYQDMVARDWMTRPPTATMG